MRLIYCYAEFFDSNGERRNLRGLDHIEVNFSTADVFRFDRDNNVLRREDRKTPLPENFWSTGAGPTNVYNVNVIVGMNGSGKTTVINYIIDLLNYIYHGFGKTLDDSDRRARFDPFNDRCILVFEDGGARILLDTTTGEKAKPVGFEARVADENEKLLRQTKLINLTNTLNKRDFELHSGEKNGRLRDGFVYDCTLGATMGSDISAFFIDEVYKQVKFVFDRQTSEFDIPDEVRIPDALKIIPRTDRFEAYFIALGSEATNALSLAEILQRLCVAASLDNFAWAKGIRPSMRPSMRPSENIWGLNWKTLLRAHSPAEQITAIKKRLGVSAISGSLDGTLRVWDLNTGKCIGTLEEDVHSVSCVAATGDGWCVNGSWDNTNILRVWDLNTGECLRVLEGHVNSVTCVAVAGDWKCVSGSGDSTLRMWNMNTGECLYRLEGHTDWVRCVAMIGDGRCVSGSDDKTLRVWDLNTGKCLRTLKGHTGAVTCVAATEDGRCVSGSGDKTLWVWDLNTGECLRTLEGHASSINCVAATGDGRCVSGSGDKTLRVWDLNTGECIRTLEGHAYTVRCISVTEDGRCVSGSSDRTLRVWDLDTGECIRTLKEHDGSVICVDTFRNRTGDEAVDTLKASCDAYLQFLEENKDGLFSKDRFVSVGKNTYELSIEAVKKDKTQYDENGLPISKDEVHDTAKIDDMLYKQLCEFIQKYMDTCKPYYTLDFDWGLSSGEENMLRIFTWLHHIFPQDDDGAERVIRNAEGAGGEEKCDSVLLFMDEADLTLHPDWQRRLIRILMAFLPQIYPSGVAKDIQVVLSTHSPLLLGDIPRENIKYLYEKGQVPQSGQDEAAETFGQNIHTILREDFFLRDGTIGAFAASKINELAENIKALDNANREDSITAEEIRRLRDRIKLVAPGILRTKLEAMLNSVERRIQKESAESLSDLIERSNLTPKEKERLRRALESGGGGA